ncbi:MULTISPECIES: efflux RND transporter permease subunit [unclassified Ruegeria]|uniref:efflux RND transporter permease subunit n=1 Tax=unclassified Ruegeria TaxID=2625375 RepID=UPI001AD9C5EB|nr:MULTISPECIES: efflux RND transporter permease subunit [unclassified Ruegeria]MBO9411608.1 efflux RND transporter permease subunit [Ruegeria sp. R8_1]MBO9415830.1 efflux RND transporter permease subunit [Ruegeria sp. R8_2]
MMREIPGAASGILSYFTRHRTVANLLLLVLLVLGVAALPNMRAQFFPDVILERVDVDVVWEGAGPEDVDNGIVQALEPALLAVEGVSSTEATSREGRTNIRLEFEPNWDMSRAVEEVRTAVDGVTNLPEDAEEPTIRRGAWRDRVTDVVVTGPVAPDQLAKFTDELINRLFAVGVTRTTIRGLAAPRVVVEVPTAQLIANDITLSEIATAVAAEVTANPAGDVTGANARIRTGTEKRTPEEIEGIPLRNFPDGSKLLIGDVAQIRVEGVDRIRSYFVGENPAMSVRVDRSNLGDAIEIQGTVEEVVAEMQASLPAGVSVELIRTRAQAITDRLDILIDNGLMGLGLVVCLLFLFLNARIAFWVAAGIPVAMSAAIAFMYIGGLSINMVSLFGLIITLGIVVDDAIVVGEHADFRARRLGEAPMVAAESAARRMAMPVFAATLTTVIAFFGLTAIGGRFGELIRDIPFTVIAVLIASLIECFLILPNHMAHAIAHSAKEHWYDWPNRVVNRGFRWVRDQLFRPFIAWVIWARYVVVALMILILASQAALFIKGDVNWRFFNAPERGSVTGNFIMAEGATRQDTLAMMRQLQIAVDELGQIYEERHGRNPIDYVLSEIGGSAGRGLSAADGKDEDLLGGISIELIDADLRPYSSFEFVGELQDFVPRHPKVELLSFRGWRSGPGGDAIDVQFYGADVDTLKAASEDLQAELSKYPEVSALEDNLAYDKEEFILDLTAQGQALGFRIETLGRVLRDRLNGIEAATFPDGPRSAEIRVELPEDELTADFLERTLMRTPDGVYVPLADIVSVQRKSGFSTVRRENGLRVISVNGDIAEDDPTRAEEINRAMSEEILPDIAAKRQVEWTMAGLSEQEDEFLSEARTGLILCLTGIYLVLAWVFASWTRPLVVMAIIPFGLVGTIWGHYIWEVPLSMFTVVGLLGMTGIIINDSIVLVTTIDAYQQDRGLVPSIIEGTADRLRPVMLTTLTTVLGLTPLLYEGSQQAQFLKPTVITLVYGLAFGMILVLVLVPALLGILNDLSRPITAMRRAVRAPDRVVQGALAATGTALLVWFGITMVLPVVTGAPLGILSGLYGSADGLVALQMGLGAFVAGAVVILVLSIAASGLFFARLKARSA